MLHIEHIRIIALRAKRSKRFFLSLRFPVIVLFLCRCNRVTDKVKTIVLNEALCSSIDLMMSL